MLRLPGLRGFGFADGRQVSRPAAKSAGSGQSAFHHTTQSNQSLITSTTQRHTECQQLLLRSDSECVIQSCQFRSAVPMPD